MNKLEMLFKKMTDENRLFSVLGYAMCMSEIYNNMQKDDWTPETLEKKAMDEAVLIDDIVNMITVPDKVHE